MSGAAPNVALHLPFFYTCLQGKDSSEGWVTRSKESGKENELLQRVSFIAYYYCIQNIQNQAPYTHTCRSGKMSIFFGALPPTPLGGLQQPPDLQLGLGSAFW